MQLFRPSVVPRLALLGLALAVAACDEDDPVTPAQISAVPSQTVTGRAGEPVQVTVRVLGSNNRPMAGQTVTFSPTTGTAAPETATTDDAGQASTVWTLGTGIGTQTMNVSVGSLTPLTISATVTAGRPARVDIVQGTNNQTAAVGAAVATRPAVVVRDAGGNPVAGATVVFQVQTGGGAITGSGIVQTDQSGVATLGGFTLGPRAGANTLTAQVLDGTGTAPLVATFTFTGTAGAPSQIRATAGNNITAAVGSALSGSNLPAVVVTDANGNPIQGVQVTFAAGTGGGTVTGATATTDALGVATVGGFTLGPTVGPQTITATAPGAGTTTFTITGTPGAPANASGVATTTTDRSVRAGEVLANPQPQVLVVDRFGNPVPGVTVTFRAGTAGAAITGGTTATTNAQGIATVSGFRAAPTPGPNTLIASVQGLPDVSITITGLAGPAARVLALGSDTVRVQAFGQTPNLTVRVVDADSFPVIGANVTFAVDSAKAGTLNPTTTQTNANGEASTRLTAAAVVDTATITARVGDLPAATFTVVIEQNAPASVREIQGNGQSATVGTSVGALPTVEVRDASGNPVVGVEVFFGPITQGSAVIPPLNATPVPTGGILVPTDAQGRASVAGWILSGTPGENVLTAVVQAPRVSGNPIRFIATGVPVPPGGTTIVIVAGNNQTAPAGGLVPIAPSVQVRNAAGQPLAGVSVEFIPSGGSIVNGVANSQSVTLQTNANGIATLASWRLSPAAGLNTLTVSVTGAGVTTQFTATGQ